MVPEVWGVRRSQKHYEKKKKLAGQSLDVTSVRVLLGVYGDAQ